MVISMRVIVFKPHINYEINNFLLAYIQPVLLDSEAKPRFPKTFIILCNAVDVLNQRLMC